MSIARSLVMALALTSGAAPDAGDKSNVESSIHGLNTIA